MEEGEAPSSVSEEEDQDDEDDDCTSQNVTDQSWLWYGAERES